ncbi:hypothetical protein [Actinomadura latina]|uniref:Uncharacterized protein n=1 Tax=Actinomadura latina TaxID=163603 RepID=A0A846Z665_9ACTN|nr:hypothetical protein [Actinomadura latina]NKZ05903.1 hypothetical protein [Actinomadura latina]
MKRPRSPYAPRRWQYAAAAVIAVLGLAAAAVIAVAAALASGNIPTAPSSYTVQLVRAADSGPAFFSAVPARVEAASPFTKASG